MTRFIQLQPEQMHTMDGRHIIWLACQTDESAKFVNSPVFPPPIEIYVVVAVAIKYPEIWVYVDDVVDLVKFVDAPSDIPARKNIEIFVPIFNFADILYIRPTAVVIWLEAHTPRLDVICSSPDRLDNVAPLEDAQPLVPVSNVPLLTNSGPSIIPLDLSNINPTGCSTAVTGVVPAAS